MMFKARFVLLCACAILTAGVLAFAETAPLVTSEQQMNDFSLAGYGDRGEKNWELSGKTADINPESVKLDKVVGNLYDPQDNIQLTAEKGDFNKESGTVHLKDNVVITTASGAVLTTDSLEWDRKNQVVATDDTVNIQKDNVAIQAQGAQGQTDLKTVQLKRDVKVDINPEPANAKAGGGLQDKVMISCDGPVEINYEKNIAVLKNNVKVERPDSIIYSDAMDVYFFSDDAKTAQKGTQVSDASASGILQTTGLFGSKIDKIVARGNVRVVRGDNVSYSDEATYSAQNRTIMLSGKPKLVITSTEGLSYDALIGN
jgi:LPS export ABC transporter protein LptC